jgi:hypothetical protein
MFYRQRGTDSEEFSQQLLFEILLILKNRGLRTSGRNKLLILVTVPDMPIR